VEFVILVIFPDWWAAL